MSSLILKVFCLAFAISHISSSPLSDVPVPAGEGIFGNKYQGDIKLTKAQENELKESGKPNLGWIFPYYLWNKNSQGQVIVPYAFQNSARFNPNQINMMLSEMRMIEDRTCVRFVQRTNEADWLDIISDDGCWSYVGRIGGRQELSMARQWCFSDGTALHEFLHALGFNHMHIHHDRDRYVRIAWENIIPGFQDIFYLANDEWTNFNTPYDLRSIMHYPNWAWNTNGQPTIIPHDERYFNIIGNLHTLSDGDAERVNRMYQCTN